MTPKVKQGLLFSEEELYNTQPTLFSDIEMPNAERQPAQDESVTVLGKTFPNDDARREYFREELRKKLPELRQIEGFPIGEDDDIIKLSDPPYYTACPNPWLNDFVKLWEEEKMQLEAEGKRSKDFDVKEPYASDVSEGKGSAIYKAHTYHTKVPHTAIMRYILHYTQPGDVVLDGFAGTGMTGLAAQSCGNKGNDTAVKIGAEWNELFGKYPTWGNRHAICGDLSPFAANISAFYNTPLKFSEFKKEANRILHQMEKDCGWMYMLRDDDGKMTGEMEQTIWSYVFTCPNCGKEYVFWDAAVDYENKKVLSKYKCPHCQAEQSIKTASIAKESVFDEILQQPMERCKMVPVIVVSKKHNKLVQRRANAYDQKIIDRINNYKINEFVPTDLLPEGSETTRNEDKGINRVYQFYTKRNLIALAHLYKLIDQSHYANKLRFIFTGLLKACSLLDRVCIKYYFHGGGSWDVAGLNGTLYISNSPMESSVLSRIRKRITAIVRAWEDIPTCYDNLQYVGSANNILLNDNSVDYIFVDPPFGSNLNYSELNTMPEYWLKVITNNSTEAVDNKAQGKDSIFYRQMMQQCFAEYFRILKPGKWMTVEFSNTSAAVWNSLQTSIQNVGFVISNVSALDKGQASFNAINTTTAVKQDLAITCYKPSDELREKIANNSDNSVTAMSFTEELLTHLPVHIEKGNSITAIIERSPKILFDRLIAYFVQHGLPVPMDAQAFQQSLRERLVERDGMFFTASQAAEYDEKKKTATEFVPMGIIVSSEAEGIAWLKNQLRDKPQTYQELQPEWMQAINGVRKGDVLPELSQLLDENFIEEADGKWRLPNIQDDVDKAMLRNKALLREFKVYVDAAKKPKGRIKEARVEALRAGFKQCYIDKDFATIVLVGDRIPQNLRDEDEVLLQFYDIALNKV